MWHDSFTWAMTSSHVHVPWLIPRDRAPCMASDKTRCWLNHVCDVLQETLSHVRWMSHANESVTSVLWLDSFTCVLQETHSHASYKKLTHMWDASFTSIMTHSHVSCDSLTCETPHSHVLWLTHMCDASFTSIMIPSHVRCLIHMWHDSFTRAMTRTKGQSARHGLR